MKDFFGLNKCIKITQFVIIFKITYLCNIITAYLNVTHCDTQRKIIISFKIRQ